MILKIKTFIEEVVAEMKKVSWTSRKDLVNSTFVVIISALCLGVFITFVDLVLSRSINLIIR